MIIDFQQELRLNSAGSYFLLFYFGVVKTSNYAYEQSRVQLLKRGKKKLKKVYLFS